MERVHENVVEAQFGPRAKAYVESAVHAQGADLDALEAIVRELRPAHALDLGTGGGHVSYLMARHAGTVTASDLSRDMLDAVAAAARERGLANIETVQAPAEHLPRAASAGRAGGGNPARAPSSSTSIRPALPCSTPISRPSNCCATPRMSATTRPRNGPPPSPMRASRWPAAGHGGCAWTFPSGRPACAHPTRTSGRSGHCRPPPRRRQGRISRSKPTARSCSIS
jgi:hypothetical protein